MSNNITAIPQYLYHYTNVDALAMILKNRSIRLNSLDKMDDLQEQLSRDKQNFGRFVFVSSWTNYDDEEIPMWRMYSPKQRGVRIKLPVNPFVEYQPTVAECAETLGMSFTGNGDEHIFKTIIPLKDMVNVEYGVANYAYGKQLLKVEYVKDKELLVPQVLNIFNGNFIMDLNKLGQYKNSYWEFQKEWRYKLMFLPVPMKKFINEQLSGQNEELIKLQKLIITGQAALPFNYFDLRIRDECFADMSITLAPDISESSKIFVDLLVKEYNPKCEITDSKLKALIR